MTPAWKQTGTLVGLVLLHAACASAAPTVEDEGPVGPRVSEPDPNDTPAAEALRLVLRWTMADGSWALVPYGARNGTQTVNTTRIAYDPRGRLTRYADWSVRWRGQLPIDAEYRTRAPLAGELVKLGFVHDFKGRLVNVDASMAADETRGIDRQIRVLYDRFDRVVELRIEDAPHKACRNKLRVFVRYGESDRLRREVRILKMCDGLDSAATVYDYVYDKAGHAVRRELHRHDYLEHWDAGGYPDPMSFKRPIGATWRAEVFDRRDDGRLEGIRYCSRTITQAEMRCRRTRR